MEQALPRRGRTRLTPSCGCSAASLLPVGRDLVSLAALALAGAHCAMGWEPGTPELCPGVPTGPCSLPAWANLLPQPRPLSVDP